MHINRLKEFQKMSAPSAVVLSNCRIFFDFDNTITVTDVLDDLIRNFSINKDWEALEEAWLEGRIGTKECLQGQLKNIRITHKDLKEYLKKTVRLDPYFYKLFSLLTKEGIHPVILSDNFTCIIEEILAHHGIKGIKVYGNALRFYRDRLIPSFPYDNPFCPSCAHCKKIHLSRDKMEDKLIVYIGDGRSDLCPARVSDIVFAKDKLQQYLTQEGRPHTAYKDLGDVYQYFKEVVDHGRI